MFDYIHLCYAVYCFLPILKWYIFSTKIYIYIFTKYAHQLYIYLSLIVFARSSVYSRWSEGILYRLFWTYVHVRRSEVGSGVWGPEKRLGGTVTVCNNNNNNKKYKKYKNTNQTKTQTQPFHFDLIIEPTHLYYCKYHIASIIHFWGLFVEPETVKRVLVFFLYQITNRVRFIQTI